MNPWACPKCGAMAVAAFCSNCGYMLPKPTGGTGQVPPVRQVRHVRGVPANGGSGYQHPAAFNLTRAYWCLFGVLIVGLFLAFIVVPSWVEASKRGAARQAQEARPVGRVHVSLQVFDDVISGTLMNEGENPLNMVVVEVDINGGGGGGTRTITDPAGGPLYVVRDGPWTEGRLKGGFRTSLIPDGQRGTFLGMAEMRVPLATDNAGTVGLKRALVAGDIVAVRCFVLTRLDGTAFPEWRYTDLYDTTYTSNKDSISGKWPDTYPAEPYVKVRLQSSFEVEAL